MQDVTFCGEVYENMTEDFLHEEDKYRVQLRTMAFVFVGTMFCIGVPSNALVLLVYHQQRVSHVMSRRFVVAVSLYDLTECLVGMSFELFDLYSDYRLDIPSVCRLVNFTIAVTTCGSMTTILLWNVELFNRIVRPLSQQFTSRKQITYIAALFVASLVFSIPVFYLFGRKTNRIGMLTGYDCGVQSELHDSIWTLLAVCIITLLGLLVVVVMLCVQFEVIKMVWIKSVKRKPTIHSIPPDIPSQNPQILVTLPDVNRSEVDAVHHLSTGATQTYISTEGMEDMHNRRQLFESGSSVDAFLGDSVDPKPNELMKVNDCSTSRTSKVNIRLTSPSPRPTLSPAPDSPQAIRSKSYSPKLTSSPSPNSPRATRGSSPSPRPHNEKLRKATRMPSPTSRYLNVPGKHRRTTTKDSNESSFPNITRSLSSLFSSASASFTYLWDRMLSPFHTSSLTDIGQQGMRVVVLMVLATVVFCLSILPALVVLVLWVTVRDLDDRVRCDVTYFATYNICMRSYFLSAAANPFLYSYSRPRFRQALQTLFGKVPDKSNRKPKTKRKRKV